ncbi:MAG: hypothetical protein NXI23_03270 [Bacteroidetes bacterium]|jgi:hypothetical protein|nr:hypothetical protein [Bacteroidota bacterium]MDF1865296.1 hypothetical protein [Saprospiraceae bacterium]
MKLFAKLAFLTILLLSFTFTNIQANIVVKNGLSHLHDVTLGKVYKGSIEIQNTTDREQSVKLYQRDYQFFYTGEAFYEQPGSHKRSNANWIDLSTSFLTLGAKEEIVINYEIQVPENFDLPGTSWSVIIVEGVKNVDPSKFKSGININTVIRYAIQIATTIEETGSSDLHFAKVDLNKSVEGIQQLEVDVENIGERLLVPEMTLELFNNDGESVGIFTAEKRKTYPGTSVKYQVNLSKAKAGNYQAILLADCGEEEVFGVNISLEISND